jgi:two-component system phosphate regulon sensor histidine kinase PhoR
LNFSLVVAAGLIALATIAVSVAASYLMVRRHSRSVCSVTEGVRQLATGNLDYRVETQGTREATELAQSLNVMADSLRKTIQDLSGERNKLSAVLATMRDGIIVVDPGSTVLMINQAAREMLNVGSQVREGRRLVEVARDHQVYRLTSDCLATGELQLGEVVLFRPRRFLGALATPLKDNSSSSIGVLITLHDLTRTRQMENSQREFVSNVSHELRNPLASVKAMVETLEDGAIETPEVARNFLERIHHDLDRMNSLVNELLELSRLESGQLSLKLEPLELEPLVEDIRSRFNLLTQERSIDVVVNFPPDFPRVMADEDRTRQVIINLMENALKFTPPGGQVTFCAEPKPEGSVEVTVTDTGVGISQEHLPHIFERFYKVDRSRHASGTGLGLAIVKQLVEAHGGEVWVKSQEGAGSTFGFSLPIGE